MPVHAASARRKGSARRHRASSPHPEPLEDRWLLASCVVTDDSHVLSPRSGGKFVVETTNAMRQLVADRRVTITIADLSDRGASAIEATDLARAKRDSCAWFLGEGA